MWMQEYGIDREKYGEALRQEAREWLKKQGKSFEEAARGLDLPKQKLVPGWKLPQEPIEDVADAANEKAAGKGEIEGQQQAPDPKNKKGKSI